MSLTESTMLALGTAAPDFTLPDAVSGRSVSLADVAGDKGTLVMFLCAHCPFVLHVQEEIARLSRDYEAQPIGLVGISSNWVGSHPQDGPDGLKKQAADYDFRFPYLYDETQEVAHAYTAACTPDIFLFDADGKLAYRGQLDSSRPSNEIPVTGGDLRAALDALLAGEAIPAEQTPSVGCNIKWRPGNEPDNRG